MYTHKLLDPLLFFIFEYSNANLKHLLIFTLLSFTLIFKKEMKSLIYLIAKQKWRCLFSSRSIFSFIWQFNFVRNNPIIMQTKNYYWLHKDNVKIHMYIASFIEKDTKIPFQLSEKICFLFQQNVFVMFRKPSANQT